ncbi:MAG: Gfo/Idh/MocA family oxidoreductase [Verrucomicrobiota bacterium]
MQNVRWALIGAGDIAQKRVGPALMTEPRSRLKVIIDVSPERAKKLADQLGGCAVDDRLDTVLADPAIDAVYLATPVCMHVEQVSAALKAGKHVLCEKPLALNCNEARCLTALDNGARQAGVAYFRRFYPKYLQAQDMLKAGTFGQVVLLRLAYHTWCEIKPENPKFWRMLKAQSGGGVLSDMGCHMFDVMIGLFGLPATVFARVRTQTFAYEVEDSAVMVMRYAKGPDVTASFNWNSKTWTQEFEIVGTEAKVKWHPYDSAKVTRTVGRNVEDLELPNHVNVHYPMIADFVSAVIEDRAPAVTIAEAVKTNLLLDAIYRSSESGREVNLTEVC